MYLTFDEDYHGIFIHQRVRDLSFRGVTVKKGSKISPSLTGYFPFYYHSLKLIRNRKLDPLQSEYIPHNRLIPAYLKKQNTPLALKFFRDDIRIYSFQ